MQVVVLNLPVVPKRNWIDLACLALIAPRETHFLLPVCFTHAKTLFERGLFCITRTRLFEYIENYTTKNRKFSNKKSDIFFKYISAQNIDCGYSLEPPHRGGSDEYYNL